jgi:LAS superfamily LD-carboxypeptidase LdcB
LSSEQLNYYQLGESIHRRFQAQPTAAAALELLYQKGLAAGHVIAVASGYRSYQQQLKIWQEKVEGRRPVLDNDENPLAIKDLSSTELLFAILRWSAIPGFSRHHWGSDFDIYDYSTLPTEDYQVQLTVAESDDQGIFGRLHLWLDQIITQDCSQDFFRPFANDRGGVAPERWHISHAATARSFEQALTFEQFKLEISQSSLPLKPELLKNLSEIFERFILP